MIKARFFEHTLDFIKPSGTSRGVMHHKQSWFIALSQDGRSGIGECGLLKGLSVDDRPDYEEKLDWACRNISLGLDVLLRALVEFPSIQFGLEMAWQSLLSDDPMVLFPSDFTKGADAIPINGLIWMNDFETMARELEVKLASGFSCMKLKIGAIDFEAECELLGRMRERFDASRLEIRVDANGAFDAETALYRMSELSGFVIHSIEQPVQKNQHDTMSVLAKSGVLPVALDEELIGVFTSEEKRRLLDKIAPQYIVLKPSLVGGFSGTNEWITLAEARGIGWWITSALESNVGLNAIAQWTYTLSPQMAQGLGTGALYTNNAASPLEVRSGALWYVPEKRWSGEILDKARSYAG